MSMCSPMSRGQTGQSCAWSRGSTFPIRFMRLCAFTACVVAAALVLPLSGGQSVPLLPDGRVNLGPLNCDKGVWEIDYIENMANQIVGWNGSPRNYSRLRGSAAEPQVPFMPWSAAVYD